MHPEILKFRFLHHFHLETECVHNLPWHVFIFLHIAVDIVHLSFSVTKSGQKGGMFIKIRALIKVFLELGLELWKS